MPTVVQFRRGTTAQNNSFTGASGELSVDTQLGTIRVHNGIAGGNTLASIDAVQTLSNKTLSAPTITGTLSSNGLINTSGNIICASITAGTYVGLSSNKINQNGSNVTVDTSWVNVAVNGSNVFAVGSTGIQNLSTTNSTSSTTGALIVTGGVGIGGNLYIGGNLTVQGTTTTVNSTTVDIADLNITVAKGAASAAAANGGGLTVDGASATLLYTSATDSWNVNKVFISNSYINTTGNISAAIGNFGNVNITGGTYTGINAISPAGNSLVSLGSLSNQWNIIYGKATTAQYADLAEIYTTDQQYLAGTVVVFDGEYEVMQSHSSHDTRIAGVVSSNPAYLMNSNETGIPVALQGRVPCRVLGPISKGDRVVSSHIAGVAQALDPAQYQPGCIIGKALQAIDSTDISVIEVVVGRL